MFENSNSASNAPLMSENRGRHFLCGARGGAGVDTEFLTVISMIILLMFDLRGCGKRGWLQGIEGMEDGAHGGLSRAGELAADGACSSDRCARQGSGGAGADVPRGV
jgi:hypothetical protein